MSAPEPRIASAAELERTRDALLRQLGAARAAAAARARRERRAREVRDAMVADPGAHRWEVVSADETGEPGCATWEVGAPTRPARRADELVAAEGLGGVPVSRPAGGRLRANRVIA